MGGASLSESDGRLGLRWIERFSFETEKGRDRSRSERLGRGTVEENDPCRLAVDGTGGGAIMLALF